MRHNEGESIHPNLEHSHHIQTQPKIVLCPESQTQIATKTLNTKKVQLFLSLAQWVDAQLLHLPNAQHKLHYVVL